MIEMTEVTTAFAAENDDQSTTDRLIFRHLPLAIARRGLICFILRAHVRVFPSCPRRIAIIR